MQGGPRLNWTTIVIGGGITIFVIVIILAVIQKLKSPSHESAPPRAAATANSNAANSNTAPAAAPATTPDASQAAATPTAPAVPQGEPLVVKLEATIDNCSLQYWVDDAPKPTSVLIRKGESQNLPPAQNQVRLNIGNRPAVKMSINNREAKFPEGTPNWGAKVTVSHDNLQTFFQ